MKKEYLVILLSLTILGILIFINLTEENKTKNIGGEKDEKGCLIAAGYSWNETLQKCVRQEEINERNYTSKNSKICSDIQINCKSGYEYFYDSTGCGCQLETAYQKKVYCVIEQRDVGVCIEIYRPVCGYKFDNSKQTYSNFCFACLDKEVEYWIEGEC
jgi:hypothetical protein